MIPRGHHEIDLWGSVARWPCCLPEHERIALSELNTAGWRCFWAATAVAALPYHIYSPY